MKQIITFFSLLVSITCLSQDAAFVVLDVSGNVMLKSANKPALLGSKVANNETVVVAKGGKVTLACKNSGCVQYGAGTYTVKASDHCKPVNDPALARLCKFAWHQFSGEESGDWREHLDNLGAASRGKLCGGKVDHNLSDINYYNGDFNIKWTPVNAGEKLILKVYTDPNALPVIVLPVEKNTYTLAALKAKLKEGVNYYWNITPKNGDCDEKYQLHMLTRKEHDATVSALAKSVNTNISNKAEQQYLLGVLLENKHFFADALAHFKKAAQLAPADTKYSTEVANFKKKYGM